MQIRCSWSVRIAILSAFLLILIAQPMKAQSQNLSGTVIDESGAVVPEAAVNIMDAAKGGTARQTTTDPGGRFLAIDIEPGKYLISVEKVGFKRAELTVILDVNSKMDVGQIKLQVGNVSQILSVSAESTPLVTTNTMDKAYVVDRTQMSELPMNGRNFTSLMNTVPGMTSAAQSDFNVNFNDVSQFHALGGRGSENNMYLDGSPNIDVGDNQSQYTQASIDTIAEFRVLQSGFNAEVRPQFRHGDRGPNQVRILPVSRHGIRVLPQQLAGCQVREFATRCCRNCATTSSAAISAAGCRFPRSRPGMNKKMFFFYNREMTRRNLPSSSYADVPNSTVLSGNSQPMAAFHQHDVCAEFKNGTVFEPGTVTRNGSGQITGGVPFPNNTVPQSMWQPLSANLLKIYTGIPGYTSLGRRAPNPGYVRYYLQQSRQSGEKSGPAAHRLRDQQQDEQFLPLGERLPERDHRKTASGATSRFPSSRRRGRSRAARGRGIW